jgi:hypothetical protein
MGIGLDPQVGERIDGYRRRRGQMLELGSPELRGKDIPPGTGLAHPQESSLPPPIAHGQTIGAVDRPAIADHHRFYHGL